MISRALVKEAFECYRDVRSELQGIDEPTWENLTSAQRIIFTRKAREYSIAPQVPLPANPAMLAFYNAVRGLVYQAKLGAV